MKHAMRIFWLGAIAAMVTLSATAQIDTAPLTTRAAPSASSQLPGTTISYRSAFDGYLPFKDEKPLPWKDTNSTVEQIGGWRAYAKEAPEPKPNQPQAQATEHADPHAGHAKP